MGVCTGGEENKGAHKQIETNMNKQLRTERQVKKLLLLGSGSSGKSTLFKQLKCIHGTGFDESEAMETRHVLRTNCITGILTLLKQSQSLFDRDNDKNADCLVKLPNEF